MSTRAESLLPTPVLKAEALSVAIGEQPILHDLDFSVNAGRWIGVLGPNGSGKTTLLRAISGVLPYEGKLTLMGSPVRDWSPKALARRVAYVRQSLSLSFDFTVEELVRLGRSPHKSWLQPLSGDDLERVRDALERVDLEDFAERSVLSLSGGELQRVFLAQALVQEADLLLLDEPTTHLDVHYQFSFMRRVQDLIASGHTVITVFHDLELAARFTEKMLVLQDGRLVASGAPHAILTPTLIEEVFRMQASVDLDGNDSLTIHYHTPSTSTV